MAFRSEEEQIRAAAESLLGSSSSHQLLRSHDSSVNNVLSRVGPPADVATGLRPDGRMSVVRRFFCLLVTFDLLFTILMWLICLVLISEDVFKMMSEQIVHYSIRTSLFDIVMAAAVRFVALLLFYGLLYMYHWIIIALSTAGTCSFLVAKLFLYNWTSAASPALQVLLIVSSFVISWGEAWFIDFRVIPQEMLANAIYQGNTNERSPLLRQYLQGYTTICDDQPESIRNFYSPLDSPADSDNEEGHPAIRHATSRHSAGRQREVCNTIATAREAVQTAELGLNGNSWHLEKENEFGDTVKSCSRSPKKGKIYHVEANVEISPKCLLRLLFYDLANFPDWNPTLTSAERLEVIDEQTDISYQVMAPQAGGMVTPRDFVTLRRWERRGNSIILGCVSTTHSAAPLNKEIIRAQQGPSCWVLEPGASSNNTRLRWLCDIDLRGWLPQSVVDQAYAGALLDWVTYLRKHAEVLEHKTSNSENFTASSCPASCTNNIIL